VVYGKEFTGKLIGHGYTVEIGLGDVCQTVILCMLGLVRLNFKVEEGGGGDGARMCHKNLAF